MSLKKEGPSEGPPRPYTLRLTVQGDLINVTFFQQCWQVTDWEFNLNRIGKVYKIFGLKLYLKKIGYSRAWPTKIIRGGYEYAPLPHNKKGEDSPYIKRL